MKAAESSLLAVIKQAMPLDFGTVRSICNNALRAEVRVRLPDGDVSRFDLLIEDRLGHAAVREHRPAQLPLHCPERHIRDDGTFCLGLSGVDHFEPRTKREARRWWQILRGFLLLQTHATAIGRWVAPSWRHGAAPMFQRPLDQLAQSYPTVVAAARAWFDANPSTNDHAPCDRVPAPTAPSSHDAVFEHTIELLVAERTAEETFWRHVSKDLACCKTMKNCPLNDKK